MLDARGPVERRRDLVVGALCAYLALVTVAPVATTPHRSDDIINQGVPRMFAASGQSVLEYIVDWVGPWVRDQGRFFPGSAAWTFAVFTTFQSRFTYKLFLAGLVLIMIGLVAATVATLSTPPAAAVAVATLAAGVHLRDFFDGLDSFSGVLPLTVGATLACLLLLVRRRGWVSGAAVVPIWTYVLMTYEVAVTLVPTLCALVWWVTRRWVRMLPFLVPAVVVVVGVAVLRTQVASVVGNAYRINLEPVPVLVTYLKQAAGALPWSTQWYPGTTARMTLDPALLVLAVALVGLPVAVLLTYVARERIDVTGVALARLFLLGGSMWLLPPLLVAVSLGWQTELPPGHAYVSVVWGYVGVAVLAAAAWLALARGEPAARGRRSLALHVATGVIGVAAAASVAQSVAVAALLAVNPH